MLRDLYLGGVLLLDLYLGGVLLLERGLSLNCDGGGLFGALSDLSGDIAILSGERDRERLPTGRRCLLCDRAFIGERPRDLPRDLLGDRLRERDLDWCRTRDFVRVLDLLRALPWLRPLVGLRPLTGLRPRDLLLLRDRLLDRCLTGDLSSSPRR